MKIEAKLKHVRMSAKKLRDIARVLKGKSAHVAVGMTECICRKSARIVGSVLKSALANAENNNNLSMDRLVVETVIVEEGPVSKRFIPAARGSAHPIRKRTSHVRVVLKEIEKKRG